MYDLVRYVKLGVKSVLVIHNVLDCWTSFETVCCAPRHIAQLCSTKRHANSQTLLGMPTLTNTSPCATIKNLNPGTGAWRIGSIASTSNAQVPAGLLRRRSGEIPRRSATVYAGALGPDKGRHHTFNTFLPQCSKISESIAEKGKDVGDTWTLGIAGVRGVDYVRVKMMEAWELGVV